MIKMTKTSSTLAASVNSQNNLALSAWQGKKSRFFVGTNIHLFWSMALQLPVSGICCQWLMNKHQVPHFKDSHNQTLWAVTWLTPQVTTTENALLRYQRIVPCQKCPPEQNTFYGLPTFHLSNATWRATWIQLNFNLKTASQYHQWSKLCGK